MDNASGIATLLESAKAVAAARPKRSVVFVAVTAEEKGLLGSRYYALNPTVPRDGIVANINMDMFLPLFPLKTLMVLGLDESDLGDDVRAVAAAMNVGVQADPEPQRNRFIRSDQYSFIREGVPALAMKVGYEEGSPEAKIAADWTRERYHAPVRRPRPADRPRRRRRLHEDDRRPVRARRQPRRAVRSGRTRASSSASREPVATETTAERPRRPMMPARHRVRASWLRLALAAAAVAARSQPPTPRTHRLEATPATVAYGYYWAEAAPVLRIASGDIIDVDTLLTNTPGRARTRRRAAREGAGVAAPHRHRGDRRPARPRRSHPHRARSTSRARCPATCSK